MGQQHISHAQIVRRQAGVELTESEQAELEMEGVNAFGYGTVAQYIMRRNDIPLGAKAVYAYLSAFTGAGRTCFPSMETMAGELACSRATVRKHLQILQAKGIIKIEHRIDDEGSCISNLYKITSQMPVADEARVEALAAKIAPESEASETVSQVDKDNYQTDEYSPQNDIDPGQELAPDQKLTSPGQTPHQLLTPPSKIDQPRSDPRPKIDPPQLLTPKNILINPLLSLLLNNLKPNMRSPMDAIGF